MNKPQLSFHAGPFTLEPPGLLWKVIVNIFFMGERSVVTKKLGRVCLHPIGSYIWSALNLGYRRTIV